MEGREEGSGPEPRTWAVPLKEEDDEEEEEVTFLMRSFIFSFIIVAGGGKTSSAAAAEEEEVEAKQTKGDKVSRGDPQIGKVGIGRKWCFVAKASSDGWARVANGQVMGPSNSRVGREIVVRNKFTLTPLISGRI